MMLKLGILASGRGSNLQSIIDNIRSDKLEAEIRIIISDHNNSGALIRAEKYNIDGFFINPDNYGTKQEFEEAMINQLKKYDVELVIMAGFMRILSPYFLRYYPERVMNIHPSLLPAFPGLNAQRQALEYGVKISGCTVHFVDEGMDTGPVIIQAAVPVKEDDTEETLSKRILEQEHIIYPEAIRLFARNRLEIRPGRVKIINKE
jgi:phosphoribosylglycinamide formyltransferase 1